MAVAKGEEFGSVAIARQRVGRTRIVAPKRSMAHWQRVIDERERDGYRWRQIGARESASASTPERVRRGDRRQTGGGN
ncbi:hypothetical protein E2562_038318 [Oryza meyeriana var. granulata]|uniref:Uncharacterized protein n=1 Tax=Oryza meyeriana var. granulata TaxID=110450 RepID=A0A6G1CKK8_9ORYZ|nr:hypothetical protein E2562_038318 [Oryza meyeriana var. granulata]